MGGEGGGEGEGKRGCRGSGKRKHLQLTAPAAFILGPLPQHLLQLTCVGCCCLSSSAAAAATTTTTIFCVGSQSVVVTAPMMRNRTIFQRSLRAAACSLAACRWRLGSTGKLFER